MRTVALAFLVPVSLQAQDSVQVFWSGALSPDGIHVRARLSGAADSVRLAYCASPCASGYSYSAYTAADSTNDFVASLMADGLSPGSAYTYRFEVNGALDTAFAHQGRFTTPEVGPTSFSFVHGTCNSISWHPVWQAMAEREPLFFLCPGDLHYRDPNSTDLDLHRAPFREDVLGIAPMRDFLHRTPIAYVWDDHDFCGNGSDGSFLGRYNAARAFREYVPHYPLHSAMGVHQSFTIGRVHFIMSDLRSGKSPQAMMGIEQFAWLLGEFIHARDNGLVACWVSPLTWNSVGYPENWACQPAERTALSDFLYDQEVKNLFILSGDAHMLAIDDGTHADFSSAQDLRYYYPIFQAAAISRDGSYKGGQFNQGGVFPNPSLHAGQFGEVLVEDDGEEVCITFNGWRTDSMSASASVVNSYTFCRTPPVPPSSVEDNIIGGETRAWFVQGEGLIVQDAPLGQALAVQLHDMRGAIVFATDRPSGGRRTSIPLPALGRGLYIARVILGNEHVVHRFVALE